MSGSCIRIVCLTGPGRSDEATTCEILPTEKLQAVTTACRRLLFLHFSQEENNLTKEREEKKKHQVKMTGKKWKNQASSDVWNVLLLIFPCRKHLKWIFNISINILSHCCPFPLTGWMSHLIPVSLLIFPSLFSCVVNVACLLKSV